MDQFKNFFLRNPGAIVFAIIALTLLISGCASQPVSNTPAPFTSTAAYNRNWQTTSPHAPTKTQRCHCSPHIADHAAVFHPTHSHNTFIGCIATLALAEPVRTRVARHFLHHLPVKASACSFSQVWRDTRALPPPNATSPSMTM